MTDQEVYDLLVEWNALFPGECERYSGNGFYGPDSFYFGSIDADLRNSRNDFLGTPSKAVLYEMFIDAAVQEAIKVRGWKWGKRSASDLYPFEVYALGPKGWAGRFVKYEGDTLFRAFIQAIKNEE